MAEELTLLSPIEHALSSLALVHQLRLELADVQARAEASIVIAQEQGFDQRLAMGMILRGWVLSFLAMRSQSRWVMPAWLVRLSSVRSLDGFARPVGAIPAGAVSPHLP